MIINQNFVFLMVFLFIGSCGSSGDRNLPEQSNTQPPANLEQAMTLAKTEASTHPEIDFRVEHVTDSELSHSLFEEYYFLYIWGPMGHTQSSSFAIAPDGSAFMLPNDFNSMAQQADLSLNSHKEALNLLEFYLNFHTVWPGTDYQKIVGSPSDIPGIDNQEEESDTSLPDISPPAIINTTTGWSVDFYTWRAINGVLFRWTVNISQEGTFHTKRIDKIEERVGNFLSIE